MTTNNFTLNYNVTGNDRKRLADKMAEILGCEAKYLGVPTFNYVVDYFTVDKSGTVIFDDRADSEEVENLIEQLEAAGFHAENEEDEDMNGSQRSGTCSGADRRAASQHCVPGSREAVPAQQSVRPGVLEH